MTWHGGSCREVCGTILWIDEQDDSATPQSISSMHRWSPLQRRRKWNLSENCQKFALQIVLKCFHLARIRRPDFLWSVNKLARAIIKWTKTCDKRLNRLISYIHHTSEYKQHCHVGNTAEQCRLGLFQTLILRQILKIQNPLRGEHYVFSEITHLFQQVGCARNKHQFLTVQQNLKLSHWTQDWDWMVCLLWNCRI